MKLDLAFVSRVLENLFSIKCSNLVRANEEEEYMSLAAGIRPGNEQLPKVQYREFSQKDYGDSFLGFRPFNPSGLLGRAKDGYWAEL